MTLPVKRFLALDVFRGLTVCFMIIVNTPGNGDTSYSPLHHAKWHGFTPTDLVFPSFLFAVGNALSFVSMKWETMAPGRVIFTILKRGALIFLLGFLMYWFPFVKENANGEYVLAPLSGTRILGVLQRIGLAYAAASLLVYFFKARLTLIISISLLLLYWFILLYFGDPSRPFSMIGNAGYAFDLWLMGEHHLYHGEGVPFDPEGWLSTIPAVVNVTAGYLAGRFIQSKGRSFEGLSKLLLAGKLLVAIGYFWDLLLPINKKLWTSSFVVYTVGLDCLILGTIIYLVDLKNKTGWTYFFEVFGRNPLFIYLLSEVGAILLYFFRADVQTSLYQWTYEHIFFHLGAYLGSLIFALSFMLLCWLAGYFLDKKRIYIRV
jgi:predicted acyltransferase